MRDILVRLLIDNHISFYEDEDGVTHIDNILVSDYDQGWKVYITLINKFGDIYSKTILLPYLDPNIFTNFIKLIKKNRRSSWFMKLQMSCGKLILFNAALLVLIACIIGCVMVVLFVLLSFALTYLMTFCKNIL